MDLHVGEEMRSDAMLDQARRTRTDDIFRSRVQDGAFRKGDFGG